MLGGKQPVKTKALVDTGSQITLITSALAQELGIPLTKSTGMFCTAND